MINLTFIHLIILAFAAILLFFIGQLIGYKQGIKDTQTEFNYRLQRFKHLKHLINEWQQFKNQPQEKNHDQQ